MPHSGTALGERIRQIRNRAPRHEFARELGIGTSTLQRYESGERRPDADLLRRICETYNVNPSWLLLGSGPVHLDGEEAGPQVATPLSLKQASGELLEASQELGFEPPVVWSTLIQELMALHGLSPAGARRLLETLSGLGPRESTPEE